MNTNNTPLQKLDAAPHGDGEEIFYRVRASRRARTMRLTVRPGGILVATRPWGVPISTLEHFIHEKIEWLARAVSRMKQVSVPNAIRDVEHFETNRAQALQFVKDRVDFYNSHYGFSFHTISVRNQRTRWGSCSRKGHLSFNYRLLFLPRAFADYVVVHELCHLKEFNHSKRFWELVGATMPDYRSIRKKLRNSINIA